MLSASLHLWVSASAAWLFNSTVLFWADEIRVYPTCIINPQDQVVMEVLVTTLYTPASLYQPTAVSFHGNDVSVDLFVEEGAGAAVDHLLVAVDVGQFSVGNHGYTVAVHDPSGAVADAVTGSIEVADGPCPSIGTDLRRMFWAESQTSLRSSFVNGARVECMLPAGFTGASGFAIDSASHRMYWTERAPSRIRSADLGGSNVRDLIVRDDCQSPAGLVLDLSSRKMYWRESDLCTDQYSIRRSNLDGTDLATVATALEFQHDMVVDSTAGKIYWIQGAPVSIREEIWRAQLDGSNAASIVQDILYPTSLVLDPIAQKLYWADRASNVGPDRIRRTSADGSDVETFQSNLIMPDALALDVAHSMIYWHDFHNSGEWIRRANLDGSNLQDLVAATSNKITIDSVAGKLYWLERSGNGELNGLIRRADLNGSNVNTVVTDVRYPFGLVLEETPSIPALGPRAFAVLGVLLICAGTIIRKRRQAAR